MFRNFKIRSVYTLNKIQWIQWGFKSNGHFEHFSSVFPVAAYQLKNETAYSNWSYFLIQIIHYHSQHLRHTKSYILHVGRVLHLPLSEGTVARNLMQVRVRDFSISIIKNIAVCFLKKTRKTKGTQLTESNMRRGKRRT